MGTASDVQAGTIRENEERVISHSSGMPILILLLLLFAASVLFAIRGGFWLADGATLKVGVVAIVVSLLYLCVGLPILCAGLKVVRPNEAYVFTLFGKYVGSLKDDGFYFVNPFVAANNPLKSKNEVWSETHIALTTSSRQEGKDKARAAASRSSKISLKAITLNNDRQKINDLLGNPIEIGIVVIWRVVNTAKAVFNVENYQEYLSTQCDSALRNIVRLYPYDVPNDEQGETSLRGSSQEIALKLRSAIQEKVEVAGIEVMEARITHLAYAPEIAAAMLQRQQASAIVDARTLIVQGAVGMVQQALTQLDEHGIVELDEERKAQMVSNLLVVLCGNKDAQPIVNSGSLY
jgi:regulator of protease activity HflC (stomatin/prohibitin superfamily)